MNDFDEPIDLFEEDLFEEDLYEEDLLEEDLYEEDLYDDQSDADDQDGVDQFEGHRDRIRLQISNSGLNSLSPRHALEFMLYYVLPRQDVTIVAKTLMEQFGDLKNMFKCSLDDFRQVEGLGETGAQWLDIIGRSMRAFADLTYQDNIFISNRRQLMHHANKLRRLLRKPCCLQLVTTRHGTLLLRRPISATLEWAEQDAMSLAAEDAALPRAENAYLLVFTDNHRKHPGIYDLKHLRDYAVLMRNANCCLRDVLFIGPHGYTSMYSLNKMPNVCRRYRRLLVSEDEIENIFNSKIKTFTPEKQ